MVFIPFISIIIPTFNEESSIKKLIQFLRLHSSPQHTEIIISDGGSTDNTIEIATDAGAQSVLSPAKGRAAQMNFGASIAKGTFLYFVHADTCPPATFVTDIINAGEDGFDFGRYRTKFDSRKFILKVNAFFTRFDWFICYGGDQTFFISKKLFDTIGGFNSTMLIMEDYEIVQRAKENGRYKIFSNDALVSARKYETNSWLTVQLANRKIVKMYQQGKSQQEMVKKYKELLNYR